jgi:serine/threonine-protein kinase RsbW
VPKTSKEGRIVLASRLDEVSRAESEVLRAAEECGFEGADRFAIKLALEEALANAIKHGNKSDPSKRVTLEFAADPDRLRITVHDEGPGFDPRQIPDCTLDENLEKPSGRGVMLMRAYMNDVVFNKSGNCVTLVKWRGGKNPAAL